MSGTKKMKFKSAEHKRRYEENQKSWEDLKKKWERTSRVRTPKRETLSYSLSTPPGRSTSHQYPSMSTVGGNATRTEPQRYTGDSMLGIATLHKSNAVPVFQQDDAKDISAMRR